MPDDQWEALTTFVVKALADNVRPVHTFVYNGEGSWQGVVEQSRAIVAIGASEPDDAFRAVLRAASAAFGQDAISLSIGEGELV
jgi:hypothetical protein